MKIFFIILLAVLPLISFAQSQWDGHKLNAITSTGAELPASVRETHSGGGHRFPEI